MSSSPNGLQNPKFDTLESGFGYTRTSYTALTTSYGAHGAWVANANGLSEDTIILIDEVRISVRAAQYKGTISGALSGVAVTSVVVGTAIPAGTPAVGILYLRRTTGANTAISAIPYTSWAGSTFTIGSTDFSTGNVANGSVVTASADLVVTLKINAVEMPIHFPASAQESMTDTFVWKPKGNLVVTSTSVTDAFNAKASATTSAWISTKLRYIRKSSAMSMRLWDGGGIPLIAVSGATTAATAKQIIAPLAGHHCRSSTRATATSPAPRTASASGFGMGRPAARSPMRREARCSIASTRKEPTASTHHARSSTTPRGASPGLSVTASTCRRQLTWLVRPRCPIASCCIATSREPTRSTEAL